MVHRNPGSGGKRDDREGPAGTGLPAPEQTGSPSTAPTRPLSQPVVPAHAGAAAVPPDLVGHPRYQVLGLLGTGGMGAVYKARHRLMGRVVALKVIHPDLSDRPEIVNRFLHEVWAAARLAHPNIVTAYDADQVGATHFLVMEFVEGVDLERFADARGPLPVAQACDYVRQAALGLQYAHEQGMVHRDIKPHNLMLTPQGRVKILDFGLSRLASELALGAGQAGAFRAASPEGLTPEHTALGTADYAAPEECQDARRADIRADVYSLGCTLYRLLTGRVPFPGGSLVQKLLRHRVRAPAPVTDARPDVPAALAAVVAKMLAKDPGDRHQEPAEVARALAPCCAAPGPHVLVVDDEPAARRALAALLEQQGYAVSTAANGREALDRLRQGPAPVLILLDLAMPVMDGIQFLQERAKDPALAPVPVLIVSAVDSAQAQAAALGAADYLRKPVAVAELAERVRQHAN
jgi:CheY-like chemotaxis protein/tRNA A-37 threonylcarbamoyl transferase component Bud32